MGSIGVSETSSSSRPLRALQKKRTATGVVVVVSTVGIQNIEESTRRLLRERNTDW